MIERQLDRRVRAAFLALALAVLAVPLTAAPADKVNINTAGAEELSLLPRVGDVVARRIVEFRQKNGKFSAVEDLMLVQGIGERTFELMEPYLALEGETTLKEKVRATRSDDGG